MHALPLCPCPIQYAAINKPFKALTSHYHPTHRPPLPQASQKVASLPPKSKVAFVAVLTRTISGAGGGVGGWTAGAADGRPAWSRSREHARTVLDGVAVLLVVV